MECKADHFHLQAVFLFHMVRRVEKTNIGLEFIEPYTITTQHNKAWHYRMCQLNYFHRLPFNGTLNHSRSRRLFFGCFLRMGFLESLWRCEVQVQMSGNTENQTTQTISLRAIPAMTFYLIIFLAFWHIFWHSIWYAHSNPELPVEVLCPIPRRAGEEEDEDEKRKKEKRWEKLL